MTIRSEPYRVVLVEGVPSLLDALRWALEETPDMRVVGQTGDGRDALTLATDLLPDLMIVDVGLDSLDTFVLTRSIKALPQPPAVLLLAAHRDASVIRRARAAGSDGVAGKDSGWDALITAIRGALAR